MSISSGVGSLVGGLVSGGASLLGGSQTNSANAQSVQNQEAYETQMSDTAYQRQQADMKAAGLNPILSANAGGASTPGVTAAPVINSIGNAGTALASGLTNFGDQSINGANALVNQANSSSSVALNSALQAKAAADTSNSLANAANTNADTAIKTADLPVHVAESAGAKAVMPLINSAIDAGQSASSKLSNAFSTASQNNATHTLSFGQGANGMISHLGNILHNYFPNSTPSSWGSSVDTSAGISIPSPPPPMQ